MVRIMQESRIDLPWAFRYTDPMIEYIEIVCRWIFGLQMFFWGLNGFFHWVKIPPSDPKIDAFVNACMETRFIMPTVKLMEIIGGAVLLLNFAVPATLVVFAPLIFVISGLHILHNPKPWGVLVTTTVPYLLLVFFHNTSLLRLVH
ncbi:hypothetical protein [Bdellovibrio bacteriovorus]|uniref:hypothetical protein n=1 Tax=Bdellovibrio bacteriovorus TaxID=959 RepID=UPI003CFF03A3